MNNKIIKTRELVKNHPQISIISTGAVLGIIFGMTLGGVGIAARGNASRIDGWLLFGIIGAIAGIIIAYLLLNYKNQKS